MPIFHSQTFRIIKALYFTKLMAYKELLPTEATVLVCNRVRPVLFNDFVSFIQKKQSQLHTASIGF